MNFENIKTLHKLSAEVYDSYKKGETDACRKLLPPSGKFYFGTFDIDDNYADDILFTRNALERIIENEELFSNAVYLFDASY